MSAEEKNIMSAADATKSEQPNSSKETFAYERLKKENRALKFENTTLKERVGHFETQAQKRTFIENGGKQHAFSAWKKHNAELLQDADTPINWKQMKKEQDFFFTNTDLTSSNDGIKSEQAANPFKIDASQWDKPRS